MRRLVATAVGIALMTGAVWIFAGQWHPSDVRYPRQGIDVSHHQGVIDWTELAGQGVDFAYIKATEGGNYRDSRFGVNWAASRRARVPRGAYHFFSLCRSGAEQAANFIAAVPVEPDALPPAIDLEYLGNCGDRPSPARFHAELAAFLSAVEQRYGKPAILYLTREFDDSFDVSTRVRRPLWLRSIFLEPSFGTQPWEIWQVSNFRRLRGIDGRVDWNVARR